MVLWEKTFFLSDTPKILINGKAFEGTIDYVVTDDLLPSCSGNSDLTCLTQFRPTVFPYAHMVHKLLLALHSFNLCCFLTGK